MPDLRVNMNRSKNAIYSRILSGCTYLIKFGLNSPELFLRRVHKRQAKKLRKKGVRMNVGGFEYAIAENIMHDLKTLPSPLIPANLYTDLRQLLDIYDCESRTAHVRGLFKDVKPAGTFVLQALLKTLFLLGSFDTAWNCHCGRKMDGNMLSNTMVALSITSYIMRESCPNSAGHWFLSWGQQASDVEVVKILIKHWRDVSNSEILPSLQSVQLSTIRAWYCNHSHGTHPVKEPNEIPALTVDEITTTKSVQSAKQHQSDDFEISFYNLTELETENANKTDDLGLNSNLASLDSLDQLYMDNMENLKSLRDHGCPKSANQNPKSAHSLEDLDQSNTIDFLQWVIRSKESENIWSPSKSDENKLFSDNDIIKMTSSAYNDHVTGLARNILSGCGSGVYDMWGDAHLPVQSTDVASLTRSTSYWSDYKEVSRRDLLISRIRNIIHQTIRKRLEKKFLNREEGRKEKKREDSGHGRVSGDSSAPNPKLISPPRPKLPTSRIMDLLVKANPITDIAKLEKLADKVSPVKKRKSESYISCDGNPFEKPPHLIKEFVPKIEHKIDRVAFDPPVVTTQLDLKPIKLSLDPYLSSHVSKKRMSGQRVATQQQRPPIGSFPLPITRQHSADTETNIIPTVTPVTSPFDTTNSHLQRPMLSGTTDVLYNHADDTQLPLNSSIITPLIFNSEGSETPAPLRHGPPPPGFSASATTFATPSASFQSHNGGATLPASTQIMTSECLEGGVGGVPPLNLMSAEIPAVIPPIPEELATTTPPNLPTIIMLSQLFSR